MIHRVYEKSGQNKEEGDKNQSGSQFPVSSQDHSWILTTADLVQTDASRKQRSRANIEGITPRVDGRVKQASRRGWEDRHFESRPPGCQPTSRSLVAVYFRVRGIDELAAFRRLSRFSPFPRWETRNGKKIGRPTLYALRACTCACARALSFSLTRYRKVRRDDVTSIAYRCVTVRVKGRGTNEGCAGATRAGVNAGGGRQEGFRSVKPTHTGARYRK
ncbi:hypothetical protein ALC57_08812 [Trachymyrmex cornetzi]|uniref:Uncharacterized protein n=1 Tax=Trachymyrmex cornetzi TaxID=471704 RepID=A0A151J6I3_9HYME|nr:hypothetical protein ALC57_08812 [Trachymyrmex cornetzi]